ncbi:MAG: tetratricopeptide repeat protein [Myxococcales bacterium FL481]|nr:MAG: tetratricopeptide repeat protein [Myxococcales bacterium FL481]
MANDDRLASPTLALLYIAQGHVKRAREVVDALLEEDPRHGAALAMRARLSPRPSVSAKVDARTGELAIRWHIVDRANLPASLHVVIAAWSENDCAAAVRVTSTPCDAPRGSTVVAPPMSTGAMTVCLAGLDESRRFVPVAVAEPLSW